MYVFIGMHVDEVRVPTIVLTNPIATCSRASHDVFDSFSVQLGQVVVIIHCRVGGQLWIHGKA